jgi:hypothetical protein
VKPDRDRWIVTGFCLIFLAAGCLWIGQPGLQADESFAAATVFYPERSHYATKVFGHPAPLMQLSYLGSLKTYLHSLFFLVWAPSPASLRLQGLAAGALTIFLTWMLVRRLAGRAAGLITAALLAVDPSFLWTTRCDWGPVALQHLLAVGGVCAVAAGRVPLGFFLFGLAFWDKAVFAWTAGGLVLGWLLVWRRKLPLRACVTALLALLIGAYPLLRYNLKHRGATVSSTARISVSNLPSKIEELRSTLEGRKLYGYLMRDGEAPPWLPRSTANAWLLVGCAALALRSNAGRFFLAVLVGTWSLMVVTDQAGESAHHIVLAWPWPMCVMGVGLAEAGRRFRAAAAVVTALACLLGAGVIARHYFLLHHYGSDPPWSGAIFSLHQTLRAAGRGQILVNDWGILEPLAVLSQGQFQLRTSFDMDPEKAAASQAVFVGHVDRWEAFPGVNRRVTGLPGFRKELIATVHAPTGEPVFEVFLLQER